LAATAVPPQGIKAATARASTSCEVSSAYAGEARHAGRPSAQGMTKATNISIRNFSFEEKNLINRQLAFGVTCAEA